MDPIADFLIRIKNGYLARKEQIESPWSKMRETIARLLARHGYLGQVKVEKIDQVKKKIIVKLKYDSQGNPAIREVRRISKPGRRIYASTGKIPYTLGGMGITIVSTSQGIMIDREARKRKLGGEIIGQVW